MKDFLYFIGTAFALTLILYFFFDYELSNLFITLIVISIAYGLGRVIRDIFDEKNR